MATLARARARASQTRRTSWERFQQVHRELIMEWLVAERVLSQSQSYDFARGVYRSDRLVAAESALQAAVVDFALQESGPRKAPRLSRELLRQVETLLQGIHLA
ncbi:MAG: hypothetical protein ACYDGR_05640 [Candidatus Dormibacteria bacterium]